MLGQINFCRLLAITIHVSQWGKVHIHIAGSKKGENSSQSDLSRNGYHHLLIKYCPIAPIAPVFNPDLILEQ